MNDRTSKQYKCLPFFAAAFITVSIFIRFFEQKEIWASTILATNFLSPLIFILNDIISEVYGYKSTMTVFWSAFFGRFIFFGICSLIFITPSPGNYHHQNDYNLLFKHIWYPIIVNPFELLMAWWLNAHLIIKWKILLKGKYFWLRSIGSSGIAEILFAVITFLILPYAMGFTKTLDTMLWLIAFRLFFSAILAFPASLIVSALKTIEKVDAYDKHNNFNPFKKEKSAEI